MLPKKIITPKVPPIKIQGIKTKLVPFIAESIKWDGEGTYFEPFMGTVLIKISSFILNFSFVCKLFTIIFLKALKH